MFVLLMRMFRGSRRPAGPRDEACARESRRAQVEALLLEIAERPVRAR